MTWSHVIQEFLFRFFRAFHQPLLEFKNYDEILYADDTICLSESAKALTKHLNIIEEEGKKYGLQLNQGKCELIRISRALLLTEEGTVTFQNGQKVKTTNEAKYLGCWLNAQGDPGREIRQRKATCMLILKKLQLY